MRERLAKLLPISFRGRLALSFGTMTLVLGILVYGYVGHVYRAQLLVDRGEALHDLATAAATVLAENLHERQREIELLAATPLYRRSALDSPDLRRSLERLQHAYPAYSWIGVTDAGGVVRSATGGLLAGVDVSQRPWFINGRDAPFMGDLHDAMLLAKVLPDTGDKAPPRFLDIAAPIRDERGALRGVLGAHIHWNWASDVVSVLNPLLAVQKQRELFIADHNGQVIYPGAGARVATLPPLTTAVLDTQSRFTAAHWEPDAEYVSAAVALPAEFTSALGWRIVVRQPLHVALQDVVALQRVLAVFALAIITVFLALIWWSATRISRPLEQLAGLAMRIENGEESTPLEVEARSVEVRHLIEALRSMASRLIERREALRDSNARLEHTVAARTAELEIANEELQRIARHDALTSLPNRRAVDERLHEEFIRMRRMRRPLAVLLCDIDHFKRINDTYGHALGDEVLCHVARTLQRSLRESDFIARYGGEEFIALLPATSAEEARHVADKLRRSVETHPHPLAGRVTLSIGFAVADGRHEHDKQAVREADDQLYAAKREGRNRVCGDDRGGEWPSADAHRQLHSAQ